jgi:hypothetical protein
MMFIAYIYFTTIWGLHYYSYVILRLQAFKDLVTTSQSYTIFILISAHL